jgi:hypothetical protein
MTQFYDGVTLLENLIFTVKNKKFDNDCRISAPKLSNVLLESSFYPYNNSAAKSLTSLYNSLNDFFSYNYSLNTTLRCKGNFHCYGNAWILVDSIYYDTYAGYNRFILRGINVSHGDKPAYNAHCTLHQTSCYFSESGSIGAISAYTGNWVLSL